MQWLILEPELAALQFSSPFIKDTAVALTAIADHHSSLVGSEISESKAMGAARQYSFSSGRHCVRQIQAALGMQPGAIERRERAPIWPKDCVGSISHSNDIALAAMSRSLTGIGADIERQGRVTRKIWSKLFTQEEVSWLKSAPDFCADLIFSAKEAGYKAIYPLGQRFIGFHEAQIELDLPRQQFRITYLGSHKPNALLDVGVGYWHRAQDHVLTIFLLD